MPTLIDPHIYIPPCPTVKEIAYNSNEVSGSDYTALKQHGRIVVTITGDKVNCYDVFRDNAKSTSSENIKRAVQKFLDLRV